MKNPVLVALDVPTADEAERLARMLEPHVGGYKVGLELLMAEGPAVLERIAALGRPVFCDAKLHDIPNTVAAASRRLGRLGVRWVSVHAAGGRAMLEAAVEGLADTAPETSGILAVTVLTSLGPSDLDETGVCEGADAQVVRLSRLAGSCGVEGVVCSVAEASMSKHVAPDLVVLTPGIRPEGADAADQSRVATPARAIESGADLLVVGRPITRSDDPPASAEAIAREVTDALSRRR